MILLIRVSSVLNKPVFALSFKSSDRQIIFKFEFRNILIHQNARLSAYRIWKTKTFFFHLVWLSEFYLLISMVRTQIFRIWLRCFCRQNSPSKNLGYNDTETYTHIVLLVMCSLIVVENMHFVFTYLIFLSLFRI